MMARSQPAPPFQLRFLKEIQRILEEGRFTATYKFALVHALADLSVQLGDDDGEELELRVRAIARRFTELYWRQVAPWPGQDAPEILAQNTGQQAAIVRAVREAREEYGDRIDHLRTNAAAWDAVTTDVRNTVRTMPLLRLQTVGRETRDFLYKNQIEGRGDAATITLKPGVAFCFRAFHPLVVDLSQARWAQLVRRMNPDLIGERTELREFLFGAARSSLEGIRMPLVELQEGRCFYCDRNVGGFAHVDHFIPWSRYPVDLGHNFVATHDHCNRAKADHLSAVKHLDRWIERNATRSSELTGMFERAGIPHDHQISRSVTSWAYEQVEERGGLVWVKGRTLEPLDESWRRLFGATG